MKNMKIQTKLIIGFIIIDILAVLSLIAGYQTVDKIITVSDPQRYADAYHIFTLACLILFLAVSTFISVSLIRNIARSIEGLTRATKQIAEGKVDVELEKERNDEFGVLTDEFLKVIDNIHYQAGITEAVANGNMTVNVVPKSDQDVLTNSLKKLVEKNYNALVNISDAAHQVSTSSSQVASASESLAQGSTEQASAIEQITASIGEIAEKTKQNATEANTASDLIMQAITDVKKGNEQMQDMMNAMQDINRSSESISKIIKVIDDIAFQTNILALNAAVEAARAGEAGKGFAVVAEEVRNLAAKSAAAASETAELIEDSIHKVEAGSRIADDTAKALEAITSVVQQSEVIIGGIAEASNYQATAVAQIDQAIGQVSQVVQTNSATSEECAAASEELSNQAKRMRGLLSVYNLGNNTAFSADESVIITQPALIQNEPVISLGDGFGKY